MVLKTTGQQSIEPVFNAPDAISAYYGQRRSEDVQRGSERWRLFLPLWILFPHITGSLAHRFPGRWVQVIGGGLMTRAKQEPFNVCQALMAVVHWLKVVSGG